MQLVLTMFTFDRNPYLFICLKFGNYLGLLMNYHFLPMDEFRNYIMLFDHLVIHHD